MAVAGVLIGCGDAERCEPKLLTSHSEPTGDVCNELPRLADACAAFEDAVQGVARPREGERLVVTFDELKFAPDAATCIDLQFGEGHSGDLTLIRLRERRGATDIERVRWIESLDGGSRPRWSAQRASVDTEHVAPLLNALAAMSSCRLRWEGLHDAVDPEGREWAWSSRDFFELVRARSDDGRILFEQAYAGYPDSDNERDYLALLALGRYRTELIDSIDNWQDVEGRDLRSCHVSSAFLDNQLLLSERDCWWVLERSLNALGVFGDRSVVVAIEELRETVEARRLGHPDGVRRRVRAMNRILQSPDVFLDGPPVTLATSEGSIGVETR